MRATYLLLGLLMYQAGCASSNPPPPASKPAHPAHRQPQAQQLVRETPPTADTPKDIRFPAIQRSTLDNGLEVNVVELEELPVVYLRLVIRSGSATDPKALPGIASLTASMLKEGTKHLNSAKLAEAIEYYGAQFEVGNDADHVYLTMQTLNTHLEPILKLLAEVITRPAFNQGELDKLIRREQARLDLQNQDPYFLAARQLYRTLYCNHPYAQIDTTTEVLKKVTRTDLTNWHHQHAIANNAFLVVAGKVNPNAFHALANQAFHSWRKGDLQKETVSAPTYTHKKQVFVVDRPNSVQSVIYWGNLSLRRGDKNYIPLAVANQILGGSAASRLFMDLREKQSLTYGAYSRIGVSEATAPFRASAAVRTEVTVRALQAFETHLNQIRQTPATAEELANAQQYLSDSFPLKIETLGSVASLIAELRLYGLPDGYWDEYRSAIRQVSAQQALSAAKAYITPDTSVIVVVGKAADITEPLRSFGDVTVVDTAGKVLASMKARPKT